MAEAADAKVGTVRKKARDRTATQFTAAIPPETLDKLRAFCEATGISQRHIIGEAVDLWLEVKGAIILEAFEKPRKTK